MQKSIRIGTRASELAIFQANIVKAQLATLGYQSVLVPIKSVGDTVLEKPLYEFGITGIFTKNLDIALLNNQIDIAVHSLKDVPTILPKDIVQIAVLKRGNPSDILVLKTNEEFFAQPDGVIATGSLRRKAQWLHRYPTHKVVGLRGNVNTRLNKLNNATWNGAIFAAAGLSRLGIRPKGMVTLSWMIPAPAQGAIAIMGLKSNSEVWAACQGLNHKETEICTAIERKFLQHLEGGCSAPIGALAFIDPQKETIRFKGVLLDENGTKKIEVDKTVSIEKQYYLAKDCAEYILKKGGNKLMQAQVKTPKKAFSICATKKLSDNQKKLLSASIAIQDHDFIKIRFNRIAPKIIKNELKHVIITSKNSVEAILNSCPAEALQFKNIYCVGRRTKQLIERRITKVAYCAKNATKLATYLCDTLKNGAVTYFCSNIRLDTLPEILTQNGIVVNEVITYKTIYSPVKLAQDVTGVLFFSPSGVESYLQKNTANNAIAFCIGESTAKVAHNTFKEVKVAKLPTVESVIALVNSSLA